MKRRLTREERRRRSNRTLRILTYLCFIGLLAIWLIGFLALNVDAEPPRPEHTKAIMPEITLDELEAAENELIEAALLARSTKLEDVTITFYWAEDQAGHAAVFLGIIENDLGAQADAEERGPPARGLPQGVIQAQLADVPHGGPGRAHHRRPG